MAGSVGVAALCKPYNMLPERYAAVHFPAIVLEDAFDARLLLTPFQRRKAFCTVTELLINLAQVWTT